MYPLNLIHLFEKKKLSPMFKISSNKYIFIVMFMFYPYTLIYNEEKKTIYIYKLT